MKNWWLKLYTIPSLILTAKVTAGVFAVIVVLKTFFEVEGGSDLAYFMSGLSCLIVFFNYKVWKNNLCANLDFHKLHVPFPELKSAVIKDSLIRASAMFAGSLLCNYYAVKDLDLSGEGVMLVIGPVIMQTVFIGMMTSVNKVVNGKHFYKLIDMNQFNKYIFGLLMLILIMLSPFLIAFPAVLGFEPLAIVVCAVIAFSFHHTHFIYRRAFHQTESIGTYKRFWGHLGLNGMTMAGLYVVAMLFSYPLINSSYVSMPVRTGALSIVGELAPELDLESAKEMIKYSRYERHTLAVIFKNTPDLNQVPVSEILDKPRMSEYVAYLDNVDSPTAENIKYIMSHPIKRDKRNGYLYSELNSLIVKKWPKNQEFPKHLLAKELQTEERIPASEK